MRIGTSMWGFREHDIAHVLEFCAAEGIVSVEAEVHPQAPRHFRLDMSTTDLDRALRLATKLGVTFDALSLGNDFTTSPENLPREVEHVMAGLAFAKRIGASRVRIFAGWKRPADMNDVIFARMIDAISAVARRAESLGVGLAVENHGGITATADDVRHILRAVKHPRVGLLYDPANFVRSGQDALLALGELRDFIVYTHAKDLDSDGAVCPIGQGVLPWGAILRETSVDSSSLVIIEQTDPSNVHEATRQSHDAIRALIGATVEVAR